MSGQPFRFRLPWVSYQADPPTRRRPRPTTPAETAAPRPRPTTETAAPSPATATETAAPRPADETRAPIPPTVTGPIQRPPFRPPGIAFVQPPPPPPPLASPRTEPQLPSQPPPPPPLASPRTEPQLPSQPPPPPLASPRTEPQPPSQPPPPHPLASPRSEPQPPSQPPPPPPLASPRSKAQPPSQPPPPPPLASPRPEPQKPSQPPTTTESQVAFQPASPSRAVTKPRVASQPASPSRAAIETQLASQPSSSSRTVTEPRVASQTASPSRAAIESRLASQPSSSLPPSPSRTTSQLQTPQTQSPPRLASQPTGRISSQPSFPSRRKATRVSATTRVELPTPPVSTQPTPFTTYEDLSFSSAEPRPSTKITSENDSNSPNQTSNKSTTQLKGSEPVAVAAPISKETTKTPSKPQTSYPYSNITDPKPLPESVENPLEAKEDKKEDLHNLSAHEEPNHKTIVTNLHTGASDSERRTKEHMNVAFKEQTPGRKDTLNNLNSNERVFKSGNSTHPKESRNHKLTLFNGGQIPLHKEIKEDISKFVHKLGTMHLTVNDKPVSVITLVGDSRGASMHLGSESAKKERSVHIHRGYKPNPDESVDGTTTDAEGSSKGRRSKDSMTDEGQAPKAYINNNVQSINNSIVFNGSVTERNPGVHLDLSHPPTTELIKSNGKTDSMETHKAEFNITPAEKLTYQPTVRRRCLRGLFMESSDSDSNPDKPRHHGCRYSSRLFAGRLGVETA